MPFWMQLYTYLYGYEYAKRKIEKKRVERVEKEKGIRGSKGVKGVRDTLREIDETISKNESSDKIKAEENK